MDSRYTHDEIISAIQGGSHEMHRYVYESNKKKALALVKKMNPTLSEMDVYQDSMVELFRVIKEGKKIHTSIHAFLMGTVRNMVLNELNDERKKIIRLAISFEFLEMEDHIDESKYNEMEEIVLDVFNKMDDKCKTCLRLKYFDNKSNTLIAEELNLACNTIKDRLCKCKIKLRKYVKADPRFKNLYK